MVRKETARLRRLINPTTRETLIKGLILLSTHIIVCALSPQTTSLNKKLTLHIIFSFPLWSDTVATPGMVTFKISQQLFQCSILQARHDL